MTKEAIKRSFQMNRQYLLSKDQYSATLYDNYWALSVAIRDRLVERWITTQQQYHKQNCKRVYYLSLEFLIGRLMGNFAYNMGLEKEVYAAMEDLGYDFDELRDQEFDAGLGNGGLGRLAACFLDSMATLGIPAHGYGIRYDYGIFNQQIKDGHQVEHPDEWLRLGTPWEFARPEYTVKIQFYGRTQSVDNKKGGFHVKWIDSQDVLAIPYDVPIPGFKNDVVNTLRLWSARSTEDFELEYFNTGDYEQAVYKKILSENISKILYPNDNVISGKELRLKQEYFFTAAAIHDIIRRYKSENTDLSLLPTKVSIQLNDTHPTLAIVELMRILMDEYDFGWDKSWEITKQTFAYTNHTLMPEALEKWPIDLFGKLLPRHLQIVFEINDRFLQEIMQRYPGDEERLRRMSVIEEGQPKMVRMAHLAIIGSFSVNGVSQLHTELLKSRVVKDFYELTPEKFNNKTNGITQRRWLLKSNSELSQLITENIGDHWIKDLSVLKNLLPLKDNESFRKKWQEIKNSNKKILADYIYKKTNLVVDPQSMFDVQIKRIHEYKRQLMFAFYILSQYLTVKNEPEKFIHPRTFLIGGKAAPGYFMAKLIIKFINNIAAVINSDKNVRDKIQVLFLENYRVSLAEKIFPASDLSEQISTAGTEASGTGNMKFMLNGALTIGTLDGANIEIKQCVGPENIFIFGHEAEQIEELRLKGYKPQEYINRSPMLKEIIRLMETDFFSRVEPGIFKPLIESILNWDTYFICADFESYCQMQNQVANLYRNREEWTKKAILNVANSGFFSSDRTIREYADEIWKV
ncbi:MAG: glycogen/starch/alpha-glucan phosphorylase [Candidatus Omnitrophica bacterium]|nr:glycogen/starch/alpha-glucan phosphorylase [Candidatus Omnitrophota bacterium]